MMSDVMLDDVATLLLQADSDDDPVLGELRALIAVLVASGSCSSGVLRHLHDAAALLDTVPPATGTLGHVRECISLAIASEGAVEAAPAPVASTVAIEVVEEAPTGSDTIVVPIFSEADRSLLAEFVTESRDYLESAEAAMLQVETDPTDAEDLPRVPHHQGHVGVSWPDGAHGPCAYIGKSAQRNSRRKDSPDARPRNAGIPIHRHPGCSARPDHARCT